MYKVIKAFTDLQDKRYAYSVGDTYPREGITVSERRLEELSSDKNKRHKPLIEKVEEEKEEEFMNLPEEPIEEPEKAVEEVKEEPKADAPKKRGRKKNASNTD
jgi:hypothetical protein